MSSIDHQATQTNLAKKSAEGRDGHQSESGASLKKGFSQAIEKVVAAVLVGAVLAIGGYLFHRFQTIEDSITKHHGPGWEERLGDIIEVRMLSEKLDQLERNTDELQDLNKRLDEAQQTFRAWGAQLDREKLREANRRVNGYAELNKRLPQDENACTINRAHRDGHHYKFGDKIRVTYRVAEDDIELLCTVETFMNSPENSEVIVQISKRMADQFDYFYQTGKITVSLSLPTPTPEDENYWKTLPEVTP